MLRKSFVSAVAALSLLAGTTANAATLRDSSPVAGQDDELAGSLMIIGIIVVVAAIALLVLLDDDDEEPQSP